jgi:hypothetical protein
VWEDALEYCDLLHIQEGQVETRQKVKIRAKAWGIEAKGGVEPCPSPRKAHAGIDDNK